MNYELLGRLYLPFFFLKMCQTDPDVTGHTSPCADSVVDFKVENDGTTTIEYEEFTDKSGYKRYFARFAMHL